MINIETNSIKTIKERKTNDKVKAILSASKSK